MAGNLQRINSQHYSILVPVQHAWVWCVWDLALRAVRLCTALPCGSVAARQWRSWIGTEESTDSRRLSGSGANARV
jgi:hypothetical protein